MQPELNTNPLRDQIMHALGIKDEDWMNFNTYIEVAPSLLPLLLVLSLTLPSMPHTLMYVLSIK